ncbi:MAG: HNH endonuclease [Sphaerochaeta sp.]|nr:HNH endonuclease [Sphaerochaeta sp.]
MKAYVGVTDQKWYQYLFDKGFDEINFWRPGGSSVFRALEAGELFLFKLHAPQNYIVGGGFFTRFSILPTFLAWDAFGPKNGAATFREFEESIKKYKGANDSNPQIGCIILSAPFFLSPEDWIPVPADWKLNIVQGKSYDETTYEGRRLLDGVMERMPRVQPEETSEVPSARYGYSMAPYRIGQGAFKVMVADAYNRRCAISEERTLPVLEAAHIIPFSAAESSNAVTNGMLLRRDIHTLFDQGYLTISTDYHIEVSPRLKDDYGNGRIYYAYHGLLLPNIPTKVSERPSVEALEWHNERVYR